MLKFGEFVPCKIPIYIFPLLPTKSNSPSRQVIKFGRLDNNGFPDDLPESHICMDKVVQ
jgi:hypothetical protein